MPGQYTRALDGRPLTAGLTMEMEEVIDLGAFTQLNIQFRVVKTGSAGNVKLQHSAIKQDTAFMDLATATVPATGTDTFVQVSAFLRYIRWVADGSVAGLPVVIIEIVAKS